MSVGAEPAPRQAERGGLPLPVASVGLPSVSQEPKPKLVDYWLLALLTLLALALIWYTLGGQIVQTLRGTAEALQL